MYLLFSLDGGTALASSFEEKETSLWSNDCNFLVHLFNIFFINVTSILALTFVNNIVKKDNRKIRKSLMKVLSMVLITDFE
jgi:hypothetical protein